MKRALMIIFVAGIAMLAAFLLTSTQRTSPQAVALDYCKSNENSPYCECGLTNAKDSRMGPKTMSDLRNLGFNCTVSKNAEIYNYDPCYSGRCDVGCIPEKGSKWYLVSDKVEATFETAWMGNPINKCLQS